MSTMNLTLLTDFYEMCIRDRLNTENSEIAEGLIRFDILFYVRLKDGLSQIIINVES